MLFHNNNVDYCYQGKESELIEESNRKQRTGIRQMGWVCIYIHIQQQKIIWREIISLSEKSGNFISASYILSYDFCRQCFVTGAWYDASQQTALA